MTKDVADPETTTPNNCKCTSICSCGFGCDPGLPIPLGETKDWCNTADKCGEWSLTSGYWDYCLYKDSSKPDYLAMTWEEKTNEIMEQVLAEPSPGTFPNVAKIAMESIVTSFDDEWDLKFWLSRLQELFQMLQKLPWNQSSQVSMMNGMSCQLEDKSTFMALGLFVNL